MKIDIGQLDFIEPKLRELAQLVEQATGLEFTVTSLYRINDSGVHGQLPLRGIDLRCKDQSIGLLVQSMVNQHWIYDPDRPDMKCCMFHDVGQGAHLHLQVHPNTVNSNGLD